MMNFLIMTGSVALGFLLAMVVGTVLVYKLAVSPKFIGWYMNKVMKSTEKAMESIDLKAEDL